LIDFQQESQGLAKSQGLIRWRWDEWNLGDKRKEGLGARDRSDIMDAGDPQCNDQDDDEQDDQAENKGHVALALTGEVAFARGSGFGEQFARDVIFHAPDGRFGGLEFGG